jgi:hypothetical protein
MRCEQDRLDPVAGAEVEGMLARATNGQVREGDGRAVNAWHVVAVRFRGAGSIGRDEQLVVGNEARSAVEDVVVLDEKPCTDEEPSELGGDELVDPRTRHGNAEQEEPQQHCEDVRVAEPPEVRRELG